MFSRLLYRALIVLAAFALVGCSKAPTEKIESASTALQTAESEGAADYAPEALAQARDAKAQLDAELDAQAGKFRLFRSYGKADELAEKVKTAADKAVEQTGSAREMVKNEAQMLIADGKRALADTRAMLSNAPRGKGSAADIRMLEGDLAGVEQTLAEADGDYAEGRYMAAKSKAQAAIEGAKEVKDTIDAAVAAKRASGGR
jgi:hypothetical protein